MGWNKSSNTGDALSLPGREYSHVFILMHVCCRLLYKYYNKDFNLLYFQKKKQCYKNKLTV